MLYLTRRSSRDAYTAQRALRESRGPDGGMYLPFRGPSFAPEDWKKLSAMPFGQRVVEILNRLFQMRLTCWDVDVCIGRNPVNIESLGHRTLVAELWHNPGQSYDYLARELAEQLLNESNCQSGWLSIALRIAMLFGIYGQLPGDSSEPVDISVISGDFAAPISAYYARAWGLPIGNIVCCCNENSGLWELLRHGQLRTDAASVRTILPEADVAVPDYVEQELLSINEWSRPGTELRTIRGVVIHYVGNPGTSAAANRSFFGSIRRYFQRQVPILSSIQPRAAISERWAVMAARSR